MLPNAVNVSFCFKCPKCGKENWLAEYNIFETSYKCSCGHTIELERFDLRLNFGPHRLLNTTKIEAPQIATNIVEQKIVQPIPAVETQHNFKARIMEILVPLGFKNQEITDAINQVKPTEFNEGLKEVLRLL